MDAMSLKIDLKNNSNKQLVRKMTVMAIVSIFVLFTTDVMITYYVGFTSLEEWIDLFSHPGPYLVLGGYSSLVVLFFRVIFKRIEKCIEEGKLLRAQRQLFMIPIAYIFLISVSGFCIIPVGSIVGVHAFKYYTMGIAYPMFHALGSLPFCINIVKKLEEYSRDIPLNAKTNFSLKRKFNITILIAALFTAFSYTAIMYMLVNGQSAMYQNKELVDAILSKVFISSLFVVIQMGLPVFLLSSHISKELMRLTGLVKKVAGGDLIVKFQSFLRDEIGELYLQFGYMVNNISGIINNIREASNILVETSTDISKTSNSIAAGANQQAAAAEELAASMEEMSSNIHLNTEHALTGNNVADQAFDEMKTGKKALNGTVTALREIVGQISVLDELSGKTNLLALNASVEAARVGEDGRGFAVVAGEVRKLAERSKSEANKIDTISEVSLKTARQSEEILNSITDKIKKTAELASHISTASKEQRDGADQINLSIQELNKVTQHNAYASDNLSTGANALKEQAKILEKAVSIFNV